MNDLEHYFTNSADRLIFKWQHYFEIYDRHFSRYRNKELTLVEFGVSQGGSYTDVETLFWAGVKIYGIDINPHTKGLAEDQIEIIIGDRKIVNF